jgi:RNA-directed DNA polymerase
VRELIQLAIVRKAKGVLRKQRIEAARNRKFAFRFTRRTGIPAGTPANSDPVWWGYHPHFDPRYCISHAGYLSRTIWKKLQDGSYKPTPALQFDIEKPDGSTRQVMAFTIPDAALSNVLHRNITQRNINQFSAYSFAYRPDKNVFDAILHLNRSLTSPKSYIIQYDFSKYFDTIDHAYLENILFKRNQFLLSRAECTAIRAFLTHRYQTFANYPSRVYVERSSGVPQGSSISLFLSNAAAHDLDLCLERQNGTFVRFADDVVAITHSYRDALNVAAQFRSHCRDAGLKINYEKSPGIRLFGGGPEREAREFTVDIDDGSTLKTINHIDYLGHMVDAQGIGLPQKTLRRIKRRITEIVYKHLFLHRRGAGGSLNRNRVGSGFVDWDLVTCLNEIRNYMYGGLSEVHIANFLEDHTRLPHVRGLMAFLPLVSSIHQMRELDGWLCNIVMRAQRERAKVAAAFGLTIPRLSKTQIISGDWYAFPSLTQTTSLPSFVRSWRASRKFYHRYGLSRIKAPPYYSLMSY